MPRWVAAVLLRIRRLSAAGCVQFTYKARVELASLGLDETDARDVIAGLSSHEVRGRLPSEQSGEWAYVFRAIVAEMPVYIKLVLRTACVVVSFHEEGEDRDDSDEAP